MIRKLIGWYTRRQFAFFFFENHNYHIQARIVENPERMSVKGSDLTPDQNDDFSQSITLSMYSGKLSPT
jgi:hypothetical protein